MSLYRIGVDVGGTNTDAAILDIKAFDSPSRGVLASYKASTTPDITSGIEAAISAVLKTSQVDHSRVLSVTIGTTHFINALVEADARRLDRVAVVRLCGPFTRQIPPFSDFPVGLRGVLDGGVYYLNGGQDIDGREIMPLDPAQVRQTARNIIASGVRSVALIGVFSPLDKKDEEKCKAMLLGEASELQVVCSHDIGPTGFLERENATILNAAILRTGHRVKRSFKRAIASLNLACPLYLSQNDGTLIDADAAADHPIKTFASGPTNSMTGAAFLAGMKQPKRARDERYDSRGEPQVLVIDIGGTTTDVCALLPSGFPRQAPGFVEVGGVRTAFSMPEVVSIGLGGGSKVSVGRDESITIGPGSVGHFIKEKARVFGGPTLTSSDIVVATGQAKLGDPSLVQHLPLSIVANAQKEIKRMLEGVIEQMKVSSAPVHVLLVGGGALLVTEGLDNVDKCIRPIHQGAANAVGAAIAKISGEIDVVEIPDGRSERAMIDAASKKAMDLAVEKGAAPDDVHIVEINKMPLQYMHNGAVRIQVRAVGSLLIPEDLTPPPSPPTSHADSCLEEDEGLKVNVPNALEPTTKPSLNIDLETYRPEVRNGVWYVSEVDLEMFATGCGVLGTGGGGPTHHEYLKGLYSLRSSPKGKMRIVSAKSLNDTDNIGFGSWYGSPSVINERIAGGNEILTGIKTINKVVGNKTLDGIYIDEIGGGNGMSAFPTGAALDVPVVDGDAMGRAYPTMYHAIFSVYGHSLVPCALSDARGTVSIVASTDSPERLESLLRTSAIELGLGCAVCANPLPGSVIKSTGIPNTLSLAWYLGRAVHLARRKKLNHVDSIFNVCAGKLLFSGKIIDVRRFIGGGYTMGSVLLAPLREEDRESAAINSRQHVPIDRHMRIPFQNEYLYAALTDAKDTEATQEIVCTVPDLISILGQDGEAIGSQDLRYGLRVNVIALPAHPLWKTEQGLRVGGPEGFGLKMKPVAVSDGFVESRSVIEEFGV